MESTRLALTPLFGVLNLFRIMPGVAGGTPHIVGHRITVQNIVIWHERMGLNADEIATTYNQSLGDVYAAMAHYYDHRVEIDSSIHPGWRRVCQRITKALSFQVKGLKMLDFSSMQSELYTGVISDVLDALGQRNQAMTPDIRPVHPEMVVVGRARTVLSVDVYHVRDDCYDKEIAFLDALLPDDLVVACTNRSTRTGLWGELLSTAARARGARGTVTDGYVRDVRRIVGMGYPVFAAGMRPVDSRGRSIVYEYDTSIECGGVPVRNGDIIFGDIDGIIVIPQDVAEQVVAEALRKVHQESASRAELERGGYLRTVYDKYGVL